MSSEWQSVALKDAFSRIQSGYWGDEHPTEERSNMVRVIRNADVTRDGRRKSFAVRALNDRECEKSALSVGDIALSTSGEVGKAWLVDEAGYHVTNFLKRLTVDPSVAEPGFVRYLFDWESLKRDMAAHTGGSAIQNLRRSFFESARVTLPPLPEQRRIVDLIGSVVRYINSLQTQVEATRAARSAVLWDLFANPGDDWQKTSLKEVASIVAKRVDPTSLGDEIYVGLEHLVSNRRELSMWGSTSDVLSSTTPFFPGDTLFGRLRPYLQKGCVAPVAGFCSPEVLVLRPATGIVPHFLGLLVLRDAVFEECSRLSAGSRMPRTSAKDLMGLSALVPPLAEQHRIADLIGSIDEQVAALEFQAASAQIIRGGILSELLSGERLLDETYDAKVSL